MRRNEEHLPDEHGGSRDQGSGPLAGREPEQGRPIEDPAMADRSNPRWRGPAAIDAPEANDKPGAGVAPDAVADEDARDEPETGLEPEAGDRSRPVQSLANPDGSPNVMPPRDVSVPTVPPAERSRGTAQDQAARPLDPEVGGDNLREGRGGGTPNPALAEGGESG